MSEQKSLSKMSKNSQTPEREKRTALGMIPDDWESDLMENLFELGNGSARDGRGDSSETMGDYPVFGANGKIAQYHKKNLNEGLVIGRVGAYCGNVQITERDAWVSDNAIKSELKSKNCLRFFYYALSRSNLDTLSNQTAQPLLNQSIVGSTRLPVPSVSEQERIASVLYNVDQAIQKTEEIIEQTQRVKKGLMQDLFTEGYYSHEEFEEHHILGKYPASWEIKQVEEIGEINSDSFSAEDYDGEKFDYITLSNVSEGQILKIEETPTDEAPSRAKRRVRAGDVLIGTVRPKQRSHAKVSEEYDGNVCSTGFAVIRPDKMNPDYLSEEIFTHRFFSQMQAYVAGSGYPAVKNSDVKKIRVAVPPKEEQDKIAEVLKQYDNEIDSLKEEKKQLQRLKKGLMQDLLTGKIRTGEDVGVLDEVVEVEN